MTAEPAGCLYVQRDSAGYPADMVKRLLLGVGDFRLNLRRRMNAGRQSGEHTLVAARGTPEGVFVPMDWYRSASVALGELSETGNIDFVLPTTEIKKLPPNKRPSVDEDDAE